MAHKWPLTEKTNRRRLRKSLIIIMISTLIFTLTFLSCGRATSLGEDWIDNKISKLLITNFKILFGEDGVSEPESPIVTTNKPIKNEASQSTQSNLQLEVRKEIRPDEDPSNKWLNKRRYFRVSGRVFSRADMPDLYRGPKLKSNSYCSTHIGCIDDIPGLPSILRRANISAIFTLYTSAVPKGVRIPYEHLIHHQLTDSNVTASDISSRYRVNRTRPRLNHTNQIANRRQTLKPSQITAKSWESAVSIKRAQEYPFDLAALESSEFSSSSNTRVIIGGYFAKEDEHWIENLVALWRKLEPRVNIIKVSWPEANRGLYHSVALNSRVVGRQLSLFLHYLDQMFTIRLSRFHLVGHSLGAHIAGLVGADNGGRIGRITGLDPAGPIFLDLDASMRLDPNDARFVDVVHSNAGSITKGALGLSTPCGHVDYYPNGGSLQPGCFGPSMSFMDPVERVACNHRRSYRYFIEVLSLGLSSNNDKARQANLTTRDSSQAQDASDSDTHESSSTTDVVSRRPTAFLFQANDDELDRLTQPELVCLASSTLGSSHRSEECNGSDTPATRLVEFHEMRPKWAAKKRGLYYFKTRPESPFFGSRQLGLVLHNLNPIKRKMLLSIKLDKVQLPDLEVDQLMSRSSIVVVVPDSLKNNETYGDLWLLWKYRGFTLLPSQSDEIALNGIELVDLEPVTKSPRVINYVASNETQSSSLSLLSVTSSFRSTSNSRFEWPSLIRNRWYRFEQER